MLRITHQNSGHIIETMRRHPLQNYIRYSLDGVEFHWVLPRMVNLGAWQGSATAYPVDKEDERIESMMTRLHQRGWVVPFKVDRRSGGAAVNSWQLTASARDALQLSVPLGEAQPAFIVDQSELNVCSHLQLLLRLQAGGWTWRPLPKAKIARAQLPPFAPARAQEPQPQACPGAQGDGDAVQDDDDRHADSVVTSSEKVWYSTLQFVREYVVCLLSAEQLFAHGCGRIHHDQRPQYYQSVLQHESDGCVVVAPHCPKPKVRRLTVSDEEIEARSCSGSDNSEDYLVGMPAAERNGQHEQPDHAERMSDHDSDDDGQACLHVTRACAGFAKRIIRYFRCVRRVGGWVRLRQKLARLH